MFTPKHTAASVAAELARGLEEGTLSLEAPYTPKEAVSWRPSFRVFFAACGILTALALAAVAWMLASPPEGATWGKALSITGVVLAAAAGFAGGRGVTEAARNDRRSADPASLSGEESRLVFHCEGLPGDNPQASLRDSMSTRDPSTP